MATYDFTAERRFVEASRNPHEVLDWISDYRRHALDAAADDDSELARRFDELIEFATDHVVALKAARLRPLATPRPQPNEGAQALARAQAPPPAHAAAPAAPLARPPAPDPGEAQRREAARQRAEETATARAVAEEQARADDEGLRQLQERAAKAKARRDAALAATARIEAEAKRVAAEAERAARDEAKRMAAKEAQDAERAAANAEAAARAAAASTVRTPARTAPAPGDAPRPRPAESPVATLSSSTAPGLTPLAALFQERLAEVMATPDGPPSEPDVPVAVAARPAPASVKPAPQKAVASSAPTLPPAPADDLPSLTGADLTAFRTWLDVSQRGLAAKLGVEQSSISKGEGKPRTILPPSLRKALHLAMQEPRNAATGAS